MDHPVTAVCCFPGRTKSIAVLEPARLGLFDGIHRALAGGVLQLSQRARVGLGVSGERADEHGPDGRNLAPPAPPRRLPLALDAWLASADRHQHVALFI